MNNPLISIIIPTYNRADLLSETLDSIIAQTYANWECLIIDDDSTENNIEIIKNYKKKDSRFQLFERKEFNKAKGANSCRNIGLQLAKGDYIIFFDSDDLMTEDHIEIKKKLIESNNYDFAVTRTQYFNNPENVNPINYRGLDELPITVENFITRSINWITFDTIIKNKFAKSVTFNEKLQANQEFNYFSKLLMITEYGITSKDVVSLRRLDRRSIQGSLIKENILSKEKAFRSFWETYLEISPYSPNKNIRRYLIEQCLKNLYRLNIFKLHFGFNRSAFCAAVLKEKGVIKGLNSIRKLRIIGNHHSSK